MSNAVPSLEGSLYLTDPQSIIAYILRRYYRNTKNTVPVLGDLIISLPHQVALFKNEPEKLASNMQADLQRVLSRIFGTERNVTVSVMIEKTGANSCNFNTSIMYSTKSGDVEQTGTTISLKNGRLDIPEDTLFPLLG